MAKIFLCLIISMSFTIFAQEPKTKEEKQDSILERLQKAEQRIKELEQENNQTIYYSSGYTFPDVIGINVGETKEISFPIYLQMRAPLRYVLWVQLAGPYDFPTSTTVVELERYASGQGDWHKDISKWTIKGRSYPDYIDQNISKLAECQQNFALRGLRIKNLGPKNMTIYAIGIISKTRIDGIDTATRPENGETILHIQSDQ